MRTGEVDNLPFGAHEQSEIEMSTDLDMLLAAIGDEGADEELEKIAGPEALAVLNEMEKIAADQGIDLNQFSEDQLVEMIAQELGGQEKVAAATYGAETDMYVEKVASADYQPELPAGVDMEKVAAADYLGRVQAHAFLDELTGAQEQAEPISEEEFEKMASYRANDILEALGAIEDPNIAAQVGGREKVASVVEDSELMHYIDARAGQILDENGWDVPAIVEALSQ